MAKRLLLLAAGAIALTACTSEDVVNDVATSRNLIKFENAVNNPSRADITRISLTQFNVFGFYTMPGNDKLAHKVFYDTPVKRTSASAEWNYSDEYGERYWVPNAKYYFYAYSCNNTGIDRETYTDVDYNLDVTDEKNAKDRVLEIQNYTCNDDHQHDLIFASNTGTDFGGILGLDPGDNSTLANDPVTLQFKHILSKVKTRFTTAFPTEYEILISDITIQNVNTKGNYDPVQKWHGLNKVAALTLLGKDEEDNPLTLTITNEKEGEEGSKTQKSVGTDYFYVIPSQPDKVAIKFTIDVYVAGDNQNKVMSKTITAKFTPKWAEGYQYIYNIDINGSTTNMEVIAFETEVKDFEDPAEEVDVEGDDFEFTVTDNGVN